MERGIHRFEGSLEKVETDIPEQSAVFEFLLDHETYRIVIPLSQLKALYKEHCPTFLRDPSMFDTKFLEGD